MTLRSRSPSGRFHNSTAATSSSAAFTPRSSSFLHHRSTSPTRVSLYASPVSSSVRFSIENRSISPSRSMSVLPRNRNQAVKKQLQTPKRTCMCSPTSHPGSFRCSLHKNVNRRNHHNTVPYSSNRLNARRSAMANSLVCIGTVEGSNLVKRALAALIRPSSHQQKRRTSFQPRPSRLSAMSAAKDL